MLIQRDLLIYDTIMTINKAFCVCQGTKVIHVQKIRDALKEFGEEYVKIKMQKDEKLHRAFTRFEERSGITTDVGVIDEYNPAEAPDAENMPADAPRG